MPAKASGKDLNETYEFLQDNEVKGAQADIDDFERRLGGGGPPDPSHKQPVRAGAAAPAKTGTKGATPPGRAQPRTSGAGAAALGSTTDRQTAEEVQVCLVGGEGSKPQHRFSTVSTRWISSGQHVVRNTHTTQAVRDLSKHELDDDSD